MKRKEIILGQGFYNQDTIMVAKELLGTFLVHNSPEGRTVGRIVETEAYLFNGDPACHASRGQTKRNTAMFGPPGHSYIYLIYGIYCCFNVVTGQAGVGEAVLLRAIEPVAGIPLMEQRRGTDKLENLCSGPGKLVMAMGLERELNGSDLVTGPINILARDSFSTQEYPEITDRVIVVTTRIGIKEGAELPLRFYLAGNKFISRK